MQSQNLASILNLYYNENCFYHYQQFCIAECGNTKNAGPHITGFNHKWLDSIKQTADSTYEKKYGTLKFAKAVYYNNRDSNIICLVMKDSSDSVRQIIITKNGRRSFFGEYYANGQIVAKLLLDSFFAIQRASKIPL